jgi:hypothetical protein
MSRLRISDCGLKKDESDAGSHPSFLIRNLKSAESAALRNPSFRLKFSSSALKSLKTRGVKIRFRASKIFLLPQVSLNPSRLSSTR